MIPIFHTKFDPLQVLFLSICKIPPTGDFGDFWRFLVATFSNFIQMKLVIPIFHTKFDPLQVLFLSICKIAPTGGDFGNFWAILAILAIFVATFSNVIRIKLVIPFFHTEFDPLQVSLRHFG